MKSWTLALQGDSQSISGLGSLVIPIRRSLILCFF